MKRLLSLNVLIALLLLAANAVAWVYSLAPSGPAVEVAARLEPDLSALRQKLIEGGHAGEPFAIEVTDQEAAETIAWYLSRHPDVPFRRPQVSISPHGITARGVAEIAGLRVGITGRAVVSLRDGVPLVRVSELDVGGVGVPGVVRREIQAQIDAQFRQAENLPVIIDDLRFEAGRAIVRGKIR